MCNHFHPGGMPSLWDESDKKKWSHSFVTSKDEAKCKNQEKARISCESSVLLSAHFALKQKNVHEQLFKHFGFCLFTWSGLSLLLQFSLLEKEKKMLN